MTKPNVHLKRRTVVFHGTGADEYSKIDSIIKTDCEVELDDVMHPYVAVDVSSKSHPLYTGELGTVTSEESATRSTQYFDHFVSTKKRA